MVLAASVACLCGCRSEASSSRRSTASIASSSDAPQLQASYEDEAGRFAIAMPGKPKLKETPSKHGSGPMHEASVEAVDASYYTMWFDFPVGAAVNADGAFDGAQNNLCKQDEVAVDSTRELTQTGGFPTREIVATSRGLKPWKDMARFVYVAPRLYMVLVRGVTDDAKARAYLDSFRILSRSASTAPWVVGTLGPVKASFPDAPKEGRSQQPGPDGPMEVRTLRFARGALEMGIQLTVDPKPGPEGGADIQRRLDAARDVFVRGLGATRVALDEKVKLGGRPARHLLLELGPRGTAQIKIVYPKADTLAVGMVVLTTAAEALDRADGQRFLDSLDLEARP
jgi:hypothetical protein